MYSTKFSAPRLLPLFLLLLLFGPRFVDAQVTSASFSVVPAGLPDLSLAVAKWGDYDNDGRLDLFLSGWDTNYTPHTYLFHNDGNGAFSSVAAAFTDLVYSSAEWADLDNDGYLDLVLAGHDLVSTTNPNPVRVFRNLGNGQFALATTLCQAQTGAVASGDYDNDGKTDIAVIGDGPQTRVFRNMGNWTFLQKFQSVGGSSGSVSWVDVDGDGYLDLFVAGAVSNNVFETHLFHNTRDGNFTETGPLPVPGAQGLVAAWGDYDGDGQPDLLYSGYSTNTDGIYTGYFSAIYRNNNGTLQDIGLNLPQLVGSSGAWGDFDNDGKLDFYLAGDGSTSRFAGLFRNAGSNSFVNIGMTLIPNADGWAAWADYDNDGALDLVYGGDTDEGPNVMRTRLLHNDATLPNTPPTAPTGLSTFVTNGAVVLSWNAATDAEQSGALGYNVRIGTTPGGSDVVSPMADVTNGFRRVPQFGNAGYRLSATFTYLPNRTYYWSVQAIDNAFAGSPFAAEQSFTIQAAGSQAQLLNIDFGGGAHSQETGIAAIGQSTNDLWNFYSADTGSTNAVLTNLLWADGSSSPVNVQVLNAYASGTNGTADAMFNDYVYSPSTTNVIVKLLNLPIGTYDIYVYGHDATNLTQYFDIDLDGGDVGEKWTDGANWSNTNWQAGLQYVVFRGVPVTVFGQHVQIRCWRTFINYGGGAINGLQIASEPLLPVIWKQPVSATVGVGTNAYFVAVPVDAGPFTYRWLFNGAPLTDDGRIAGATTTNLTIARMTVADAGSYSLVASNAVGAATSSAATLTPGFPPGIAIPPQNQFVPLHGTTSLSVNAAGTAPLTYQWYRGIFPLSNGAQYSGTQTPTLTITNASAAQQGSYTVVVRNAFGVTNASATVTVVAPPTITGNPASATIIAGSNATFQVTISGSQLVDQWFFDGAPLTNGGRVAIVDQSVSAGTNKSTLTIASVQDPDAGSYWLVATNIAGSVTSSVGTLTVVHKPTITQQPPTRQTITNGTPVTLTVGATGSGPLSYQWYHGTSQLTDDGRIIGSQTSTLTFTNTTGADSGGYTLVITNAFGTVTSSNSVLNVYTPPTAKAPLARSVPLGLPTVFTASASGDFPLYYQWRLNGADIAGATNFTYTIASMTTNDVGSYSLVVSNVAGVAVSPDAMLTVGPVVGFGNNLYNQCIPPAGLSNVVAVAGAYGGFAVTADGAVVEWGNNPAARAIPADFTNIVGLAVAPDPYVNAADVAIALRADGTVSGVSMSAPATWTNIVAVACNLISSYALRSDGIVLSSEPIPAGLNNVVAISASETHVMALRNDGTVVAWQYGTTTPTNVAPALSNVVAIASGYNICLAAKSDGLVVAWGTSSTPLPSGLTNVVAVAASQFTYGNSTNTVCAALRANGKVTFWGGPINPPTNVVAPTSISNAIAIAVGYTDGLALVNDGSPQLTRPPVGGTAYSGRDFVLTSQAVGSPVITYQWLRDGNVMTGAAKATLALTNIQSTDAGNYQVVVSNALGSVTSVAAPVKVTDSRPWLGQQPISHANYPGSRVDLGVPVNGSGPLSYTWRFVSNGTTNTTNIPTTNSSLVLNPVRLTDAGTYTLVVSNAFGSTTSQQITLTVRPVMAWGNNTYGQTNVPTSLTNAIAICGGNFYNCIALRANGTPQTWGNAGTTVPANMTNLCEVSVAANYTGFFGLRTDGKPVGWGGLFSTVLNAMAGMSNIVSIEADENGSTYLRPNGTFIRLDNSGNVVNLSAAINTNIIAISRMNGDTGFMALRADGSFYTSGTAAPANVTNVVSLAGSFYEGIALKRDGTVQSWGTYTNAPMSNVVAVTGTYTAANFAVRGDGTITKWGHTNGIEVTSMPAFVGRPWALDGGYANVVALYTTNDFPPVPLYTALDTTALVVSSRSSPQWFGQTNVTHDGQHAARSAAPGNTTSSSMRMLATNGPIKVSFWWKVSSMTNHGVLKFSMGGVPQASISGEADWQQVTFVVPAGPQMLVWTYAKDSVAGLGMDAGFVDQLTFTPIAPSITLQPVSQTVVGRTELNFSAAATGTPPLGFQWFNITNSTPLASGASIYHIPLTFRSSSGTYYVMATNAYGSDRSTNFTLTVHVPQTIAYPLLQPDGSFLVTSQDSDATLFSGNTDLSAFQAQYSSNLVDWFSVTAPLSISNGVMQLNDADATNAPQRFYRIIEGW